MSSGKVLLIGKSVWVHKVSVGAAQLFSTLIHH